MKGQITACGFVTSLVFCLLLTLLTVKGQITACGLYKKRPEARISPDLRSFRLRKAPLSAFALSTILQYNAAFYTAVPQPASHQHFPARNVPCYCDNPAKASDSSQQMQTASSRSSINSIHNPLLTRLLYIAK